MSAVSPAARALLDNAFILACSSAELRFQAALLKQEMSNGYWQARELARAANLAAVVNLTNAAEAEAAARRA